MIRKAIIFAAGNGTRLRPLTDRIPKALVEVGGEPILKRIILKLKKAGIEEIVVNVHHFANQIVDYLRTNGWFGINIYISDESAQLLDTGGGILKAAEWLEKDNIPFIAHNADILTDFDLKAMSDNHSENGRDITLLCERRDTSRYLLLDSDMKMHGWCNKSTGKIRPETLKHTDNLTPYAFGGVSIITPSVLNRLKQYSNKRSSDMDPHPFLIPFSIMDFYIESCDSLNIGGFKPVGTYIWHDIGKPETLRRANAIFEISNSI